MNFAVAKRIPIESIPVVDIGPLLKGGAADKRRVAEEMCIAANGVGFFYVRNHGVPEQLIEDLFRVTRAFFNSTAADKDTVRVTAKKRGYIGHYQGIMQNSTTRDLRETFLWGREFDEDTLKELETSPWPAPTGGHSSCRK